jgi:hypothetical protein
MLLGWAAVVVAERGGLPLVCSYHTHVAEYARFAIVTETWSPDAKATICRLA